MEKKESSGVADPISPRTRCGHTFAILSPRVSLRFEPLPCSQPRRYPRKGLNMAIIRPSRRSIRKEIPCGLQVYHRVTLQQDRNSGWDLL